MSKPRKQPTPKRGPGQPPRTDNPGRLELQLSEAARKALAAEAAEQGLKLSRLVEQSAWMRRLVRKWSKQQTSLRHASSPSPPPTQA